MNEVFAGDDDNSCRVGIRRDTRSLLLMPQSRFRQINVPLDATQDFIADHILIAEFSGLGRL